MTTTDGTRESGASGSFEKAGALELSLRLSLLYLVLNPGILWYERVPILILAGWGLLRPAAAHHGLLWLLACLWTGLPLLWHWPRSDNHEYLIAYWCLAILCAVSTSDPRKALARSARLLVGLTFAFATLWKAFLSPDFADGTFFRVALLLDGRFSDLGVLFGGMTPEIVARNEVLLDGSRQALGEGPGLTEPKQLVRLAHLLTAWTLATEAAVALTFLWPGRGRLAAWRHAALLLFCATTFSVATVAPFGWLLVTMGVAQCEPQRRCVRFLYLATFFLILVYQAVPWSAFLVDWVG